jgi:hypothetical protein
MQEKLTSFLFVYLFVCLFVCVYFSLINIKHMWHSILLHIFCYLVLTLMADWKLHYMTNVMILTLQSSNFLFYVVIYHFLILLLLPVRIRERIYNPHPLVCRKRRLLGDPWRSGLEQILHTPLCVIKGDWMGRSFGWDRKTRCHVSQQVWHDKDPSLLKGPECRA